MDCRSRCLSIFDYKTEKFVIAKNKKVGLLYRLLQLGVLGYLLGWVFLVKKGYAVDTTIQSSVITKVKGVAFTNTSELKEHLWDVADYVIPSQGENVFFVVCSCDPISSQAHLAPTSLVPDAPRTATAPKEKLPMHWKCPQPRRPPSPPPPHLGWGQGEEQGGPAAGPSLTRAWEDLAAAGQEEDTQKLPGRAGCWGFLPLPAASADPTCWTCRKPLLGKAEDFTVYIKNSICFPKFRFSKTNVLHSENPNFLGFCRFSSKTPYCPVFRLGTIVSYTGNDFRKMAMEDAPLPWPGLPRGLRLSPAPGSLGLRGVGGAGEASGPRAALSHDSRPTWWVIGIEIEWNCDLDQAPSACRPHYSFRRLDKFTEPSACQGYNFRFAKYYHDVDGVEFRTLMKVYGIRFDVLVSGKAGKFNIIPLMVNVGTALALMGAGAFFCDFVLLYLIKKSHFYRDKKYEQIRMSSQKFLSRHLVNGEQDSGHTAGQGPSGPANRS
ncbi:LOW QUALITY PROTEIN: P2X purinoceptor 5-like [Sarcophilus harrisii]